ncbi:C40 family peptidase [Mucilaginibacter mali]|uniref:C40 family peptidase n=1 Tax=Mucilaginibacter mali TaxID=2740462 RepID=A0A7D4UEH7_9SPHI|nr:C40 family peptidase [Mucilaginibacter mali]QKJ31739.1 C40 family peptidase [Mucilaginibacter mali]
MRFALIIIGCIILSGCDHPGSFEFERQPKDTVRDAAGRKTVILAPTDGTDSMNVIRTGNTTPQQVVNFAQTAIGVPYKYASSDPQQGFDCSGFITYVFNHFGIAVPRTSVDFTDVQYQVPMEIARPGDLILFTGTDTLTRTVGHMGIITSGFADSLQFIHATSGHDMGVTVSALTAGYKKRFVKVVRVFPQNK